MPLELTKYVEAKKAGAVTLQRIGPKKYQVIVAKYDQFSKEPIDSDIEQVGRDGVNGTLETLDKQIVDIKAMQDGLRQLLADMDELDKLSTAPKPV